MKFLFNPCWCLLVRFFHLTIGRQCCGNIHYCPIPGKVSRNNSTLRCKSFGGNRTIETYGMELTPSSLKADTQKLQQQSLPTPKVYHIKFWMRHYSSPSMKPTMIVTNSLALGALDKGPVRGFKKRTAKRTTKRYQDSKGKKRFAGNSTLKKSQKLCCKAFLMASHFPLRH